MAGYLRGFIENINSIKNNIIQKNDYDIYIHITDGDNDDKYFNKTVKIDNIKSILNPKILISSKNINFSSNVIINNLLNQSYKFFWLNEERKRISTIEDIKYDLIIKLRPDLNINEKLSYDINFECIYIPVDCKIDKKKLTHIDEKYICDILAYGSPNKMDNYFNYYIQLRDLINKYGIINETLLYYYLNNNKIDYVLLNINYIVILSLCNTISITGDSGSGKTTLSNSLKDLFNNSFLLECDRYHKWERGDSNWEKYTHLNPEANYITKMTNDVFDLKIGINIFQVDYDHNTGKFTDIKLIESSDNIIICGLHCLYLPDNIVNLKIYIDTDNNLRIPWKIQRDVKKRGYTVEKILSQIQSREPDFLKYIYPQKEKADIIVKIYTDKIFNLKEFNIDDNLNIFFAVGIKKCYNINKFIDTLKFTKLENEENFIYFYFDKFIFEDYINIIKNFIININL